MIGRLFYTFVVISFASIVASVDADVTRPNVIVFLADDLGFGDLGCFGNDTIKTPNIDRLAEEGVRFTQAYVPNPICTPSRAALLTGRYAARTGTASSNGIFRAMNSAAMMGGLPSEEITLAEMFREKGYRRKMIGKWHLGSVEPTEGSMTWKTNNNLHPMNQGFESYFGMPVTNVQACGGRKIFPQKNLYLFVADLLYRFMLPTLGTAIFLWMLNVFSFKAVIRVFVLELIIYWLAYFYIDNFTLISPKSCILQRNTEVVEQPVQLQNLTRRFSNEAVQYIEERAQDTQHTPFFLYMPFVKVHTALFTTPEFEAHSTHGSYGDNVEEMDYAIGRVLEALDRNGLSENTFINFLSDNGNWVERGVEGGFQGYDVDANGQRARLKGGKGQVWEAGVRTPMIYRWPAGLPAGQVIRTPVSSMDLFPTLAEVIDYKPTNKIDGKSLLPYVGAEATRKGESVHESLFYFCGMDIHAARQGSHKVVYKSPRWAIDGEYCGKTVPVCTCSSRGVHTHDPPLLFNIDADPGENHPLSYDVPANREILENITNAVEAQVIDFGDVTSKVEWFARPWHQPCCGKFPECKCEHDDNEHALLEWL